MQTFYIVLQVIGIAILLVEFLFVVFQKPSKIQKLLIIIVLTLMIAFVAYIIELTATNLETAYVACILGYLGKPFAFLAVFYLLLDYTNIKLPKWVCILITSWFIFLTTIVLTDVFHHLYYTTDIYFNSDKLGSKIIVGHGPFWYMFMASTFALFIAYICIITYELKYSKTKQGRAMTLLLLFTVLLPIIGLVAFIANLTNGYESTLLGAVLGTVFFLILFIRYKLFDSLTLNLNKTLDDSDNGIVVLDAKNSICYFNNTSSQIVPELKGQLNHKKENKIIQKLEILSENETYVFNSKYYNPSVEIKEGKDGSFLGKTFIFKDVTASINYQSQLKKDVEIATEKLIKTQSEILLSFANLIESRDGYTGTHVKSVARISKLIALELLKQPKYQQYIDERYVNLIELTSPLHDVGKIKISDTILGKPGKLTIEEFEEMKKHTTFGGEIINQTISNFEEGDKVNMTKDIALYHHEKYDGTGYPCGLKGDAIPLCARIVAVADVYDALRMRRPYKEPFTKQRSIEIIKEESGTHFDPEIVDAFLRIVDNI